MLVLNSLILVLALALQAYSIELFCNDEDFFYCGKDGQEMCIPNEWVCDYVRDCPNGRDEINCNYLHYCSKDEFMCQDGHCLDAHRKCDNHPDCEDNSDEEYCHRTPKLPNVTSKAPLAVASGASLPHLLLQVTDEAVNKCGANEYFCGEDGQNKCIPEGWRCDNVRDCPNGKDEDSCEYPTNCKDGEFLCHDGDCILATHKCDNIADCKDFSDEIYCHAPIPIKFTKPPTPKTTSTTPGPRSPSPTSRARSSQTPKQNGQKQPRAANSTIVTCKSVSEFLCKSADKCIDAQLRCDNKFDCPNGEDEVGCSICEANGMNTCANKLGCYYQRCDGFAECSDSSDEMGCDEIFPQNDQFWPNPPKAPQFQCEFMKEYQENLKAYMQASMAFMNKMATPPPCPQAALENDHSVLIDGIPEPYMDGSPSARRAQDLQALTTHFDKLGTEAYPIAFYRVGAFSPNRRRGIRVIFATQEHQNDVLTKSELANKLYPQSNRIMIKRAN